MSSENAKHDTVILQKFPKQRPALPEAYQKLYEQEYLINREGKGFMEKLGKYLEEWMHKKVAVGGAAPVLEVGGGTLNHIQYEDESALAHYDVVEPFTRLYEEAEAMSSVNTMYEWLQDIPETQKYKRIISIAVLEHMESLPEEVARCGLLLDDDGELRIAIPSEGGLLWYMAWRFGTGWAFWLRNKLDYGVLMRHEHVNNAAEISEVIHLLYEDVSVKRWPISWLHGSLYTYIEAKRPRTHLCREILSSSVADAA